MADTIRFSSLPPQIEVTVTYSELEAMAVCLALEIAMDLGGNTSIATNALIKTKAQLETQRRLAGKNV